MARSKVAVIKTKPETILDDIDRLHDLAGVERALPKGVLTILENNVSRHFPFPAANTTPWQLEGEIRSLRARGYADLVCVQSKGEDLDGYLPIFKQYEIPVRSNFKPEDMTWSVYRPEAKMNVLDEIFPEGIRIPDAFHGANIVHLPTVKCHIDTTTSGAMKNAFGGLLDAKRHSTHSWLHETLVDLLAIQKEIHAGLFAVMDGTTAGDGLGPRTTRPVTKNVMLASEDQVAIDSVAASMMGFDPMALTFIRLADEQGLGHGKREDIEIVGDVELANQKWGFSVGDHGALGKLQKLLFRTSLVNLFAAGSEAYHDLYRWPMYDRRVFEQWKEQSEWGRLFDRYQAMGTLGDGG